jgi:succinoglycan biosynthesis transport protein ExoP
MLQVNNGYSSASPEVEAVEAPSGSPMELVDTALGMVRRQWLVLAVSILLTIVATGLFYLKSTPAYVATATVVIDQAKFQLFTAQAPGSLGEVSIDSAMAVESQLEIIKSEKIALKVIEDLHLVDTFVKPSRRPAWLIALLGESQQLSDFERTRAALAVFEKRLTVTRKGIALLIEISFASPSRELSAQVANKVAETYVTDQMEAKYEATRLGSAWLEGRVATLRGQAEADQRAVVEFKSKNNIVDAGTGRLAEQQLTEVNGQLALARVQASEAKVRFERVSTLTRAVTEEAAINAVLTGVLTNETLAKLRSQYAELNSRATDFEQKYGHNHQSVVNLRTQMAQLRATALDEVHRLSESYESDYHLAATREKNLEADIAKLISQTEATNRASVRLRELESAAQTATSMYDSFRKRYMESLEQQAFPLPEARVLTRAVPPPKPEYKSLIKILAAIFGAGTALGAGIALFRELSDRTYRTVAQVERRLHLNCIAMAPHVDGGGSDQASISGQGDGGADEQRMFEFPQGPVWQVVSAPLSAYAEALRSVKLAIDLNNAHKTTKVVGLTSTLPREGKSTMAASLALTIGRTGARVILVDCDLRNPALTRALSPNVTKGFVEVLSGDLSLKDALWTDRTGLVSFLPAVFDSRFSQSTEVMVSKTAKTFFENLRNSYDYVIVDLPPLAPIVDTRATVPLIDAFLFVIQWGSTKIDVIDHALGREPAIYENLLGVVLNNVDVKSLRTYDKKNASIYENSHYSQYGYVVD